MRAATASTWATVRETRDVTPTIREFHVVPDEGVERWTPGSHIDVTVLIDGQPATRSYSLVGEFDPHAYRIAVKRVPNSRGGSRYMWSLPAGARLSISAPKNFFELRHGAPAYLLIAGGIGITPLVGMASALARSKSPIRMLYAARTEDELAFADELQASLGPQLVSLVDARGETIDFEKEIAHFPRHGEAYVCGPKGLMEFAQRTWAANGRPMEQLRFETFGNTGRYAPESFWVKVPRHGVEIEVPANATLLDTLLAAGVDVLYDCKRGECGLCTMDVLSVSGEIDHRDVFLSETEHHENRKVCACVSRAVKGGLVLDSAYRSNDQEQAN